MKAECGKFAILVHCYGPSMQLCCLKWWRSVVNSFYLSVEMSFLWEYFRYLMSGPNLLHQGFSTLALLLMSLVESMQLKTISLVPVNLLWECVCDLTLIHDLLSQFIPYWCYYGRLFADPILLLHFSHGFYQHWFVNVSKFSWHKFKQQFTIITDLITRRMVLMKLQVLIWRIPESHVKYWGEFIFWPWRFIFPWLGRLWPSSSAVLMFEVVNGRVSLDTGRQAHEVCEGDFALMPASATVDWNLKS